MTINQTLDKIEEHLVGIIPAFMMLGIVVFIILGLGACVAPASALSLSDIEISPISDEFEIYSSYNRLLDEVVSLSVYRDGSSYDVSFPALTESLSIVYFAPYSSELYSSTRSLLSSYCNGLSMSNPDYFLAVDAKHVILQGSRFIYVLVNVYSGSLNVMENFDFIPPSGGSAGYKVSGGLRSSEWSISSEPIPDVVTSVPSNTVNFPYNCVYLNGFHLKSLFPNNYTAFSDYLQSLNVSTQRGIICWTDLPSIEEYGIELSSQNPGYLVLVYYYNGNPSRYYIESLFVYDDTSNITSEPEPDEPSGEGHQFDINYNADSDTYDVSLKRNGEPWYLSIKGKAFGWLPVYTYTDVSIPSEDGKEEVFNDLSLSGLPTRFFMFDLDYHASVYRAGSGLSSNDYKGYSYYWTRSDFIDENGVVNPDPVIEPEPEEKDDFTPTVKPPFVEPGGYDMPNVGTGGEGSGGSGGILSSLGVPEGIEFPSIESLEQMIANMRLPASLKDMFKYPMPEDYKASYNISSTHVLYGYVNGWFTTTETTIDLVFGVVFVLFSLIAVIPRLVFEFFSTLIEWLSTAFQSFYDWLVIPSEIFKLVIDLLPDELLSLALLLFGVDLVFLFFRFVIPGMISGSVALGEEAAHAEAERIAEEERIKAENRIGDGHGVIFNKGGRGYRGSSVSVHRPSSSLRNRGEHEETSEIRTGHGWRPHRRH